MKLIVGLGNPGKKYRKTRHNIGFVAVSKFQESIKAEPLQMNKRFLARISQGSYKKEKIILAMPATFMNNAGQSVSKLTRFYKIARGDMWIVHDDIDLPFENIRISQNISSAGHRGIESVIQSMGSQQFTRFRIGIAPKDPQAKVDATSYVLQKFSKEEQEKLPSVLKKAVTAILTALQKGTQEAMNQFN